MALAKSVTAVALAKGAAASGSTLTLIKGALKIMAWTKAKTILVGVGLLLAGGMTTITLQKAVESTPPAFTLVGHYENVFVGKHTKGGEFIIKASGIKTLVDITFENGYRETTGTDGRDAYVYTPGIACISSGRFPTNELVTFENQLLSLLSVRDRDSLVDLQTVRFYFYGTYAPEEITIQTKTNGTTLGLASIRWYAPNYMHGTGTNRYVFASYQKGYLLAEVKIAATQLVGGTVLPKEIVFTQFQQHSVTNTLRLADLSQIPNYEPDDVVPIELATFSITQAQIGRPLAGYLPEITDDLVRVSDLRISNNKQVWIESRKWYDFPKEPALVNRREDLVFDASGKLRPITMKDLQELQKPTNTNQ
jgi:hypothetical protein